MPKIIIIGGGIVGCSLADELTERGYRDVLVLEKGKLWKPGGSTSHAPGVVFQTNGSRTMAQFARQTVEKLHGLRHGGETCFLKVGSLEIATTPDRLADLHRRAGLGMSAGINARVMPPEEALKLHPLLAPEKLLGALYVPDDGIARAIQADEVMGERSISRGARFIAGCEVLAIDQRDGRVTGVQTTQGSFPADIVISCAGIWGPKIGAMVGMSKTIQPLAHQLCYTKPMPELALYKGEAELPVLRHQGSDLYFKQRGHSLAVGWYGHRPLPVRAEDILPCELAEVMPSQMPFTPEEWKGAMERAADVIPALKDSEIAESMNGLFSFTVDNFPLMGEWSGLKGFWVAEAVWITHACGVARAMAEWIVNGHPALAVHECDVNRFEAHQLGSLHIEERGAQNYVEVYDLLHPLQPMESPRPLRTTGFYQRQRELGGFFLEASGYERPQWYEANAGLLTHYNAPPRDEWSSKFWSPIIGAEARAVRDGVGLFDITTLKRIEVTGKGALEFLERLTTGKLKKPGSITYCLILNEKAGILSDITVMRRGEHDFFVGVNSNTDINSVRSPLWTIGSSMVAGQVRYRTDLASDAGNYYGTNISWDNGGGGKGWVMIVDAGGSIVDFAAFGWGAAEIAAVEQNLAALEEAAHRDPSDAGRVRIEEVDAEAHARRALDSLGSDLREIIDRGTYLDEEDAASLVEGSTPGLDEIGAALRLAELTGRPGRLVVDTAPTGHTLRLLDSPAVVRSWIRVFEAMAAKADTVASALVGRAVRLSGEAALEELARAMDGFEDLVRRADFVLITGAGAVIRAETARLRAALETRGLRVAATVAMDRPGADADVVLPLHRDLRGCEALRAWTRAGNGDPEPARPTADAEGARPPPSSPGRREPHPAVLELMDRELVLFAGKGGVGKSTCAAAAALVLAESGPILLAGADPAGSLRDVLPDPPPGVEVRELEAEAELERFRELYREEVERAFRAVGLDSSARMDRAVVESLWGLAPPGLDERAVDTQQYVTTLPGGPAATFGSRYVFGQIEVAKVADERRHDAAGFPADDRTLPLLNSPSSLRGVIVGSA